MKVGFSVLCIYEQANSQWTMHPQHIALQVMEFHSADNDLQLLAIACARDATAIISDKLQRSLLTERKLTPVCQCDQAAAGCGNHELVMGSVPYSQRTSTCDPHLNP